MSLFQGISMWREPMNEYLRARGIPWALKSWLILWCLREVFCRWIFPDQTPSSRFSIPVKNYPQYFFIMLCNNFSSISNELTLWLIMLLRDKISSPFSSHLFLIIYLTIASTTHHYIVASFAPPFHLFFLSSITFSKWPLYFFLRHHVIMQT